MTHSAEELANRLELLRCCAEDCREVGATDTDLRAAMTVKKIDFTSMRYDGLTKKQLEICVFIDGFTDDWQFPPTHREIMEGLGLASSSTVHDHIKRLCRDGVLTFDPGSPRTLRLLP